MRMKFGFVPTRSIHLPNTPDNTCVCCWKMCVYASICSNARSTGLFPAACPAKAREALAPN